MSERQFVFRIKVGEKGDLVSHMHRLPADAAETGELNRLCDLLDSLPFVFTYSIITKESNES